MPISKTQIYLTYTLLFYALSFLLSAAIDFNQEELPDLVYNIIALISLFFRLLSIGILLFLIYKKSSESKKTGLCFYCKNKKDKFKLNKLSHIVGILLIISVGLYGTLIYGVSLLIYRILRKNCPICSEPLEN